MEDRLRHHLDLRVDRIVAFAGRRRRNARNVVRLLLDDCPVPVGPPFADDVGVNLDHVAVGIAQIERVRDVVIAGMAEAHTGGAGPIVAIDKIDFVFQLKGQMEQSRLLSFRRIRTTNVRQSEVVVGVSIGDEARHVVGLPVGLVNAGDGIIELLRFDIVRHKEIGVAETARAEEIRGLILHQSRRVGHGCPRILKCFGSNLATVRKTVMCRKSPALTRHRDTTSGCLDAREHGRRSPGAYNLADEPATRGAFAVTRFPGRDSGAYQTALPSSGGSAAGRPCRRH